MIKLHFTSDIVNELRHNFKNHPHSFVRNKMLALILKYQNLTHSLIASILDICENTLLSYFRQYEQGGINELMKINFNKPKSKLLCHTATIKDYFEKNPPATIKEACHSINTLTQIKISIPQATKYLKAIGMKCRKVAPIPAKADVEKQKIFKQQHLLPKLKEAKSNKRVVYFVDAAHFVLAPFLGYLWSFTRLFIKSPAGRQRFNVLGAINAITHQLVTVTNDTYINATSVCDLLKQIAKLHIGTPITLILDNAKYQKCTIVTELAELLNIELLYLPPYSPNLNLIERLWKYVKKDCLNSKYYETFGLFKTAISNCLTNLPEHEDELSTLLALNFQDFSKANIKLVA